LKCFAIILAATQRERVPESKAPGGVGSIHGWKQKDGKTQTDVCRNKLAHKGSQTGVSVTKARPESELARCVVDEGLAVTGLHTFACFT
jgi:hypothetical protein